MKHENGKLCDRCAKMLEDAHEDVSYAFYRAKEAFPSLHTSCVYRSKDAQDAEVKAGRSYLKWPMSKHNACGPDKTPRSEAMDLFLLNEKGEAEFRMGFYVQVANFFEDSGLAIDWGGHFKQLVDGPHFQLRTKI